MPGDDHAVIRRAIELFNHMLEPDDTAYRAELGRVWVDAPEIVPMRAALEGNVYRGPAALDEFRAASMEAWSELEIELLDVAGGGPRYLCAGRLRGRGRESGAEFSARMWSVIDIEDGRVARISTHLDRESALAEL